MTGRPHNLTLWVTEWEGHFGDWMAAWWEAGWGLKEIARAFAVTEGAVKASLRKRGCKGVPKGGEKIARG